ncbi:hypothetical protein, partial [Corynebacterium durum]|uniref:hypothetical protein n=1 Tax=Corynebacterium durum TaxID=61592 RepID=UPI0028EDEC4E
MGVAHPACGGGGVLLLSRDTRLKHYFYCFCFVLCTTRIFVQYAHGVLWLESLILAQDERWR